VSKKTVKRPDAGGGWQAIRYSLVKAREVGPIKFWLAMRSKNACKTCALGMGGQLGGMVNEAGHFPEVCKKSVQAMAADMQGRIEPKFFETYTLEQLTALTPRELEHLGRLADPIIAEPGDTHYRVIGWDEAFAKMGSALKAAAPERTMFYASGRSSNEAGFLLNLLARSKGTNHITNCSYYCHQASGAGLTESLGGSTATIELDDLDRCDLVFVIGGNPPSNHPRLMTKLMELRRRGGNVIVVNPLREVGLERFRVPSRMKSFLFGTEIATIFLQPTIGGDIAMMVGIAKHLLELGAVDHEFIAASTDGFDDARQRIETTGWDEVERNSGLSRAEIEATAELYAKSKAAVFSWTMGITHHLHGVENVRWIVNLALMRGMAGKPGAGLLPIRGHSNVQGMGSIGVSPAMSKAAIANFESIGIKPAPFSGLDTTSTLEAAHRSEFDFALALGGNLFGASPDATFTRDALGRIETLVYLTTTLNTGHTIGRGKTTIILPVQARDEESQTTTQESMFNYVRLSDGGPPRLDGPRSESSILADLAHLALGEGGPVDWVKLRDHEEIRKLIARLIPNMGEIEKIGKSQREFSIAGRVLHEPKFKTPNGRGQFTSAGIPTPAPLASNQVRVMTIRSEGQFNTVVYEEHDLYRGQERRDVIMMNAGDIARMGLEPDQRVDVSNETGVMAGILVRPVDIAAGSAAVYFPESNVLVPRDRDPRSKTPAFKSVVVTIEPAKGKAPIKLTTIESRPNGNSRGKLNAC
jgi:molybdopterin-dependent oxidoreductase alpha subunit